MPASAAHGGMGDSAAERRAARTPLARLLPYHRRYVVPFWSGIAGLLLARVFEALIPLYLRDGIDRLSQGVSAGATAAEAVAWPAAAILGAVLIRLAFILVSRRVIRYSGIAVAYDLRKRLYAHLQRMDPGFFARFPTGDLMARAINDIQLIRQLIGMGTRTLMVLVFSAAVGLGFMFTLSVPLTLWVLVPLPLIAVLGWVLARRVFERSIAGFSDLSDRVQENLGGIRTVQAQVQEAREIERFDAVNDDYAERYLHLTRLNSLIQSLMPLLGALCMVAIIGYGGHLVGEGALTIGTLTAFIWYLNMVLWPVRQAGQMVTLWQRGASGTQRLFEILDAEPAIADPSRPRVPPQVRGELAVDGLTVAYSDHGEPALAAVSMRAMPGETLAIMGRVGAGKSTLLKSCVRLVDPPPGSVRLDGIDVRDYRLADLRAHIVLVPQDPFLFAELLRINVSYDAPDRPLDSIEEAVHRAALAETVAQLPAGLDSMVGERGVTLSGGQKQRTTLARGIIQDAPVLLLDDCFSSVDTQTEAAILASLKHLRGTRTTVLVTHRVATARQADRVVVLDRGRVAESGDHDALLERDGLYAELERLQRRRDGARHRLADAREAPADVDG